MKNSPFMVGLIVVIVIIAVAYWQFYLPEQETQTITPSQIEQTPAKPMIQNPISTTAEEIKVAEPIVNAEEPLPELKNSDSSMAEVLAKLFVEQNLDRFFILDHFIERFVVMVDNLPQNQLPITHRPLKETPGSFLAQGERDQLVIDPANGQRYKPLIKMIAALNTQQVVAVYKQLYPLFQQAYEGLGYPEAYFNDRLIEVIDHLLTTPQPSDPVYLTQPKALYLYADPDLERLSAGRKILIRCGVENAAQIKTLLREYRLLLVAKQ